MMAKPLKPLKPTAVVKCVGPKLVPFFKTVAIFFVLFSAGCSDDSRLETFIYCIFKCLPIFCLMGFVLIHGMNFSEAYSYSRKILIGLMFSAIGDAFLVWKTTGDNFLYGVAAFALAQVMYAHAFGIRPLRLPVGLCCGAVGGLVYAFLYPGMPGFMVYIGVVYTTLIMTMVWRAVARVQLFNDLWVWTKLCSCVGAISFFVSDFVICYDQFVTPVPYSHNIIMVSYYFAQMCITLSVVDSQADCLIKDDADDDVIKKHVIEQRVLRRVLNESVVTSHASLTPSSSTSSIHESASESSDGGESDYRECSPVKCQ